MTEHERDNWEHELMLEGDADCFESEDWSNHRSVMVDPEVHRGFFQDSYRARAVEILARIASENVDCGIEDAEKMDELLTQTLALVAQSSRDASSVKRFDFEGTTPAATRAGETGADCKGCDLVNDTLLDEHIDAGLQGQRILVDLVAFFISESSQMRTHELRMVQHYLQAALDIARGSTTRPTNFFGDDPF